jgi:hypothetical protein
MKGVGGCDSRGEEWSSSGNGNDGVHVEVAFSTLKTARRGWAVVLNIVAESSRSRDCQVDVNRSDYQLSFVGGERIAYLLTSVGSFLSFQLPLLNSPPSIGKSVLSVPLSVHGVPGRNDNLRT